MRYGPFRIQFDEVDPHQVVYHPNYLKYFDRARTDFLHQLGLSVSTLQNQYGQLLVVASVDIQYLHPAKLESQAWIETEIVTLKRVSATFQQRMVADKGDKCHSQATIRVGCIRSADFKPTPFCEHLLQELKRER